MLSEPWFWREDTRAAKAIRGILSPAASLYSASTRLRSQLTKPAKVAVPVICIGNAVLGGSGKTPFALMVFEMLRLKNIDAHFLSRGYGGELKGPLRINADSHSASAVGDEPLLLARHGATWISRNRVDGARAAVASGAKAIIMDDGFQNPSLHKDFSILLHRDAGYPDAVFPAGQFRETWQQACQRADCVVAVKTSADAPTPLRSSIQYSAWLEPIGKVRPKRVAAFAGIAKPSQFFEALQRSGFDVAQTASFADHHNYTAHEIKALQLAASEDHCDLITTEKDWVRIPPSERGTIDTFPVRMKISDKENFETLLFEAINREANHG